MPKTVLTIFLSSTGLDLKAYREELHRQITGCDLLKCVRMEDFGPQDAESVDYCKKAARDADIYIGIIGHRRGWEPAGDNEQRSITEMEYESSKERGRPRFIAIAPDDFPIPGHLREPDEVNTRQIAFRSRIGSERVAGVNNFKSPETLAAEFMTKLLSHIISSDLIKDIRPDLLAPQNQGIATKEEQAPPIAAVFEKLAEDNQIDLLAMARDPQGIDIAELKGKLITQAEQHAASSIEERRKAAEYWRHVGALAYLNDTQKALSAFRQAVELDPDNALGWNELGLLLSRTGDLDQAVETFDHVIDLGKRSGDNVATATATANLANVYVTRGDLAQAERMYRKSLALEAARGSKEGMASDYGNLGIVYKTRGDLAQAEEMQRKSLALNEALGREEGMANNYGNLGVIYKTRGDLVQAEEMYRRSLVLCEAIGHQEGMASNYGNLGNVYGVRGDLAQAEEMYRKSLTLEEALGRRVGMASDYGNLGSIYLMRGDLIQAEEMYRKSLALEEALGRKEGMARGYGNLGNVYQTRGDLDQAEGMYRKSLALNEVLGSREGMAIQYRNLGVLFKVRGAIPEAISCWLRACDLYAEAGILEAKATMEKWIRDAGVS